MEVELTPHAGVSFTDDDVDDTAEEVKDTPGLILGGNAYNPDTTDIAYLLFFDAATGDVTLGTTEPVYSVAVPPLTWVPFVPPRPVKCYLAISVAAATTRLGAVAPSSALSVWVQFF